MTPPAPQAPALALPLAADGNSDGDPQRYAIVDLRWAGLDVAVTEGNDPPGTPAGPSEPTEPGPVPAAGTNAAPAYDARYLPTRYTPGQPFRINNRLKALNIFELTEGDGTISGSYRADLERGFDLDAHLDALDLDPAKHHYAAFVFDNGARVRPRFDIASEAPAG